MLVLDPTKERGYRHEGTAEVSVETGQPAEGDSPRSVFVVGLQDAAEIRSAYESHMRSVREAAGDSTDMNPYPEMSNGEFKVSERIGIDGFQAWIAHRWGQRPKEVDKAVATLGLMGEIAEVLQECVDLTIAGGKVSEHIKKEIRGSKPVNVEKLTLEMGDVLHYLTVIANMYGVDMQDVMAANVTKLLERERNTKAGDQPPPMGDGKPIC